MTNRRRLLVALLLIGAALLVWSFIAMRRYWAIDECLDRGGRWNYTTNLCEGAR